MRLNMHLEWNKLKTPGYLEIGLAVILIITMAGIGGWKRHQSVVIAKEAEMIHKVEVENQNAKEKQESKTKKSEEKNEDDSVQETTANGQYPIMGESPVTVEQLVSYFKSAGVAYPTEELKKGGADSIETFATMYCEEAALGTTGGGVPGNAYPDVRTGIRAQIQHLKAYASTEPLNQACVDERYEYVLKGCAPYVEWLGQKENPAGTGWATAEKYGYSIVDMIGKM